VLTAGSRTYKVGERTVAHTEYLAELRKQLEVVDKQLGSLPAWEETRYNDPAGP